MIASLILWTLKRGMLWMFQGGRERGGIKNKFQALVRAFAPPESFLNRPIGVFIALCLLSALNSAFWAKALYGFLTKTLEWFLIYFLFL